MLPVILPLNRHIIIFPMLSHSLRNNILDPLHERLAQEFPKPINRLRKNSLHGRLSKADFFERCHHFSNLGHHTLNIFRSLQILQQRQQTSRHKSPAKLLISLQLDQEIVGGAAAMS